MLLEDCLQKRAFASFRSLICKGELLQYLSSTDQYYIYNSNPRQFVICQKEQVKYVHHIYVKFLLAVAEPKSRYNLFINKPELLSTITSLTIGHEVEVKLENDVIPVAAVIRYIGPLDGKYGVYFGIEILVSKNGDFRKHGIRNNGTAE